MKETMCRLMRVTAAAAALLLTAGCAHDHAAGVEGLAFASPPPTTGGPADAAELYLYYPDAEVYYAPERDLYFWRSAAFWGVGQRLPSNYALGITPAPLLQLETDKPYRVHNQVAAAFPRNGVGSHLRRK